MNKKIVIIALALVLIALGSWFGKDFLFSKTSIKAELRVKSNPTTNIFLDNENIGKTPYQNKIRPGEYELKLIPENGDSISSWQQRIKVEARTQTYVNLDLGPSEVTSSWEILSSEKIKRGETEIAVFSKTDSAEVFFDGEKKGTVPLSFPKISPGNHELKLIASGFGEKTIKIKVTSGYKLTVNGQLPLLEEKSKEKSQEKETSKKEEVKKPYALIKETETGWLQVRKEPSTTSEKLTKVNPGEKYPLLEEKSGWYKIEFEKGKEGWISGKYAEKFE